MTQTGQKIAIIGGGLAGVCTAFELTERASPDRPLEITVFERGHRLGGKAACGRGPKGEILEHGLHILVGFYANIFDIFSRCYAAVHEGENDSAFLTWEDVLKPCRELDIHDQGADTWSPPLPVGKHKPGQSPPERLVKVLPQRVLEHLALQSKMFLRAQRTPSIADIQGFGRTLISVLRAMVAGAPEAGADSRLGRMKSNLRLAMAPESASAELQRAWILFDLFSTCLVGVVSDRLLSRGIESIDHLDFTAWLRRHGAQQSSLESGLLRTLHDIVFSIPEDGTSRSGLSAAVGLTFALRCAFDYRGAPAYFMNGGTADVLLAPMYALLKKRGVKFEFFHQLTHLQLVEGRIEAIEFRRQAQPLEDAYEPLTRAEGRKVWPELPDYGQLRGGEHLRAMNADFCDPHFRWDGERQRTLRVGQEFDRVVLAVGLGALPYCAADIVEKLPKWGALVRQVKTIPTQALQVWSTDARPGGRQPCANTGLAALAGYGDMSHLLGSERWTGEEGHRHLFHVCSRYDLETNEEDMTPSVRAMEEQSLTERIARWKAAGGADFAPGGGATWRNTYQRLNLRATDAYVLAIPGSYAARFSPCDTDISNLVAAGTWVKTGFPIGAVETAAMAGKLAATAIDGQVRAVYRNQILEPDGLWKE